jgi:hypothetical protein
MTEFQFLENMAFYQRRFEYLHYSIVRKLNSYIRTNPVHDLAFYRKIDTLSSQICLTYYAIEILKDFNSDKYKNLALITDHYNFPNGVPVTKINPEGTGNFDDQI